jgi:hypothetical protein
MTSLALQRCLNHPAREAAARCVDCGADFCRECVEELDGKLHCAACLRKLAKTPILQRAWFRRMIAFGQTVVSLLFLCIVFFTFGKMLLTIPASFHEGEVWKKMQHELNSLE